MTPSDQDLVARAQAGDTDALELLLERYQPRLLRFGLRMCRHAEDAEDIVQESMIAATRTLSKFRGEATFSTWLFTIARSFCLKKQRRSKFAPEYVGSLDQLQDEGAELAATSVSPEEAATATELDQALQAALLTLPPEPREVLILRDVEGLSAAEVAGVTGLSVSAVKSKLHRARATLRRQVQPLLGDLNPPARSPDCPDVESLFSRSMEGQVDAELCHRMQAHVDGCPRCKNTCDSLSMVLETCKATPLPDVPPIVQASVRRAVRKLSQRVG